LVRRDLTVKLKSLKNLAVLTIVNDREFLGYSLLSWKLWLDSFESSETTGWAGT